MPASIVPHQLYAIGGWILEVEITHLSCGDYQSSQPNTEVSCGSPSVGLHKRPRTACAELGSLMSYDVKISYGNLDS